MALGRQELVNGRFTHFGPRGSDAKRGSAISRIGQETTVEYIFDWNDLPAASTTNDMVLAIPSGALIERAVLVAVKAATSAASTDALTVNVVRRDGTGAAALVSTTRASLDAVNKTVVGAGAGIGAAVPGISQIAVTAPAYTGGQFKLQVVYRAPAGDNAGVKDF